MSAVTSRLVLTVPSETDNMSAAPALLSGNYDIVDANLGFRTVTNLSDITTPFEGQLVFETSSSGHFIRVSGSWRRVDTTQTDVRAKRLVGTASAAGPITCPYNTYTLICQKTFSPALTKKYFVEAQITLADSVYAYALDYTYITYSTTGSVDPATDPIIVVEPIAIGNPLAGLPKAKNTQAMIAQFTTSGPLVISMHVFNTVSGSTLTATDGSFYIYEWSD